MPVKQLTMIICGLALLLTPTLFSASGQRVFAFSSAQIGTPTVSPTSVVTSTVTLSPTSVVTPTATLVATRTPTSVVTATATTVSSPTATSVVTTTPIATATPTAVPASGPPGRYVSYAANFVCGVQSAAAQTGGLPPVQPGTYATTINIHNPNYQGLATVRKKLVILVERGEPVGREPRTVEPRAFDTVRLGNDAATMDDCNRIWELANPNTPPPNPMPLMTGYLVIISPVELDVITVTTARTGAEAGGIALETRAVEGKSVIIPSTAFPDNVLPSVERPAP